MNCPFSTALWGIGCRRSIVWKPFSRVDLAVLSLNVSALWKLKPSESLEANGRIRGRRSRIARWLPRLRATETPLRPTARDS